MKLTVGQPIGNIYHNFGTFAPTPNFLLRRPCSEISSSEKLVMARLIQYCGGKGECWPSQKKLGQEVGLGELMVQKCLKRLQEIGLVKCFPPTGKYRLMHMHNTYVLLWHEWMEETAADLNDNNSPDLYDNKSRGLNDNIGASKEKSSKEKSSKEKSNICSGKNPERLDHSKNDSDGVISRRTKPPTKKSITIEVEDLAEKNEPYSPYVQRLAKIVFSTPGAMRSKQRIQLTSNDHNQWANEIRLLCEQNDITANEFNRVLDWYADHIGGEYIPVVKSGSSLRKKWPNLLAAIERGKNKPSKHTGKKPDSHIAAEPGKYAGRETVFDNTKF